MTGTQIPQVSVVLPMYRTAPMVEELVERLGHALQGWHYELVCVDDASPDDLGPRLARLAAADHRVRHVVCTVNVGQQRATMQGLAAAQGAMIVVMDADLQDPPEAVPVLVARIEQGDASVAWAVRSNRYTSRGRALTGHLFKWSLRRLVPLPVGAGSYVAMTQEVARRVLALPGSPYLVGMLGSVRPAWVAIDVPRARRRDGHSAWTGPMRLRTAARALYDTAITWRNA